MEDSDRPPAGVLRMNPVEFPLAFGHWHVRRDKLVCRMPSRTVDVSAPGALLASVLELCTGRLAWKEVAATLATRWSAESVERFLVDLCEEGALVEAGDALSRWRALGEFPLSFPRPASPEEARELASIAQARLLPGKGSGVATTAKAANALADLLKARKTHRTFADRALAGEELANILWAAHGVSRRSSDDRVRWHRTVASGGNLHSARWFVVVLRDLPSAQLGGPVVDAGLYETRFHLEGGVSFERLSADLTGTWSLMLDPRPLRFASAVLLPVWHLHPETRKYGNRATVFATLEAGQSLQNAQLMVTALGAACVVRGDTCARAILELLARCGEVRAKEDWQPMPALVIGAKPSPQECDLQQTASWMKVGPMGTASTGPACESAFYAGPVPVGDAQVYTGGRSADPRLAVTKAEAEAWERLGWARMNDAEKGTFRSVSGAMDPRAVVAYSDTQYRSAEFPCAPFSSRRKYLWVEGRDVESGKPVKLPAECVHALTCLPAPFHKHPYTNSTTSGVAAWTDEEGALEKAALELVERDAFLRCWIAHRAPSRIDVSDFPLGTLDRLRALQDLGLEVNVCRLESRFASVVCVHLRGTRRPFSAITGAAAFDVETAVAKALSEAEGRADHVLNHATSPLRNTRQVECPEDINRLYQSPTHCWRADFFASGPIRRLRRSGRVATDWQQLRKRMHAAGHRLLSFDITPPGASLDQGRTPLHVVRAFATGMLPIWFHHALAPAGLAAFARERQNRGRDGATQRLFIHPFT